MSAGQPPEEAVPFRNSERLIFAGTGTGKPPALAARLRLSADNRLETRYISGLP
jgi:hypothetical protein